MYDASLLFLCLGLNATTTVEYDCAKFWRKEKTKPSGKTQGMLRLSCLEPFDSYDIRSRRN